MMTEKENSGTEEQLSEPVTFHEGAAVAPLLTEDVLRALAANLLEGIATYSSEQQIRSDVRSELAATLHGTPEEAQIIRDRIDQQEQQRRTDMEEIIDEARSFASTGQMVVATVGNKVAAMGGYDCIGYLPDRPEIPVYKLCRVSVLPEFRKLKLGSSLMDQRIAAIYKHDPQSVITVVTKSDQVAGMLNRRKFEKIPLKEYWRNTGWPDEQIAESAEMIKDMEANGMAAYLRNPDLSQ